tara:strand:+ start:821 stop:1000 length:180 start_codon:yes stop_codon:yes gene_type:complete
MQHEVTITQCNKLIVDDEDQDVKDYLKGGGSIREYVAEHCIWNKNLGTYSIEIDVEEKN